MHFEYDLSHPWDHSLKYKHNVYSYQSLSYYSFVNKPSFLLWFRIQIHCQLFDLCTILWPDLDKSCKCCFCCNCPLFNIDCGIWMDARQTKISPLCRKCTRTELNSNIYTCSLLFYWFYNACFSAVSFSHTFEIDMGHYLGDLLFAAWEIIFQSTLPSGDRGRQRQFLVGLMNPYPASVQLTVFCIVTATLSDPVFTFNLLQCAILLNNL